MESEMEAVHYKAPLAGAPAGQQVPKNVTSPLVPVLVPMPVRVHHRTNMEAHRTWPM